jgi:hypothetical protein
MTTATKPTVQTRLTAAEAEDKYGKQMGQVWDEDLQQFVALGQALVMKQLGAPLDLAKNLESFKANRDVVIKFIQSDYFEEAKCDAKGDLIAGQLGDYYQVPGSTSKALTKRGASKIKQLFRWARGAARRVDGQETREYCSATIEIPIVDHFGRVVGAGLGSCNTAEKGFTSASAVKKYGGWCEYEKGKPPKVTRDPDYRAALHDVVSRATKRADTQATIVAAALEEIFTVAREDEPKEKDDHEPPPVYPGQPAAPRFRFPKVIATAAFKALAGKAIDDESISVEDLTALALWCRETKTKDPAALDRMRTAVDEELEQRRSEPQESLL